MSSTAEAFRPLSRPQMAARVANDIPNGWYVNLGIGVPTLVADHLPPDREIVIHSENGLLGMGPAPAPGHKDPWLINAGKQHVTLRPGGSYFHHADSFSIIRGGHLDLCVLGAFEVAENGDIANWATSAVDSAPAVGGAMDLAVGAKRVWVMMEHTTKDGAPKLVKQCSYPLTAPRAVTRVYTNLAIIDIGPEGLLLRELVPGASLDYVQSRTGAVLHWAPFSSEGSGAMTQHAYICDFVRTPIGRYAGVFKDVRPDDLLAHTLRALVARHPLLDWEAIDDIYMGCANQAGEDNRDVARMALLLAGLPVGVPGGTVNRLCGSGLDAVGTAARMIRSGDADLVIAGGVESMTRAPFVMAKAASAFSRDAKIEDTTIGWRFVNPAMQKAYGTDSMPETGENVAEQFQVSRADQDLFAYRSQQKTQAAREAGFFAREIVPVTLAGRKGDSIVAHDEHPRPETTLEALAGLKTPFRTPGTVTAGNASGVNDGAACMIIASEAAIRKHGLTPRARIVAMATAGVEPRIMGIGPLPATQKLLQRQSLAIGGIDVIELNEAFASQALAVLRGLGLADDAPQVNPHGGAIALGHPLGMSGARLALTAVNALETLGAKRAVATMCIGVGQGIAALLERAA